jgi:hypothetical protein
MLFHLPVKSSKECIAITDMTDQSDIISAILTEWGDYSPLVEPEIFGTGDPGQIARNITEFCLTELGSAIARCLFYHVSQGVVFGLCLEDDRQIVIKVHPPKQSREFLTAVYRVQRHLADHGFPCPEPILGPIPLIYGHATVEELQDTGIYADAHDAAIRRTMAETLFWLVDLTRDFADMPGLPPGILSQRPGGALWPEPHSKIFDFEATRVGSEWIDRIASKAMQVLSHSAGQKVIGHTDWSVKHFRFEGSKARVIYDWDSLALEMEQVIVGDAARGFTMTWHIDVPLAPSLDEFWAFVNEYEAARGIAFTPAERTTIAASGVYALAYSARCENCLDPGAKDFPVGSFREALAHYGEKLVSAG